MLSLVAAMLLPYSAVSQAGQAVRDISVDYTNDASNIGEVYNFFDVSVRTERGNLNPKSSATFGNKAKVNSVRLLGGWYNQDLTADTYLWNGNEYVYNFEPATKRIDEWLDNEWDIFQLVLDNPPWAFQNGYEFVDEPDGVHYLKKDRVGVYGNGLPPSDSEAWNEYIQSFITHLIDRYGKEQVESWRFRVGSEIDTRPQHWSATRQEFFDHYENTVNAIHAVLPSAVVGVHFREATHKSKYIDYTGNKEDAYAPYFVTWAKEKEIPYDFLAISYYPMVIHPDEMDMDVVYNEQISPILDHEDYNKEASFEIHEFKYIVEMKRAGFASVESSHGSAFFAMFSKMMLENNIDKIFQWGNVKNDGFYNSEALTQLALVSMVGNDMYVNNVASTSSNNENVVDGIFTKRQDESGYDVLMYNFNKDDFSYKNDDSYRLTMKVDHPAGQPFRYRLAQLDQSNNREQMFFAEYDRATIPSNQGGWLNEGVHELTPIADALNEEGKKFFNSVKQKYSAANELQWSDWIHSSVEISSTDGEVINIDNTIPSFSVQRYEIVWD